MGSGCISSSSNKDNCSEIFSDRCIVYTGDPIPSLGICQNDRLWEIEKVILDKIQEYANGEGILISDVTANCDFVQTFLANKDKNLYNLLQAAFDMGCSLRALIQEVQNNQQQPFSFNLKCLVTPTNPTRDQITQSLIDQLCDLTTTVNNIINQLEQPVDDNTPEILAAVQNLIGNYIGTNISSCPSASIQKTGSGSSTQLKMVGFVPIGGILPYAGSTANFDNTGKGLASACMDNFAICNGQNGTIDLRGWNFSGATRNVPGSNALLSGAEISADVDTQTQVGNRKGASKVTLSSVNQIPAHTHDVVDPGHSHTANHIASIPINQTPEFGQGGAGTDLWVSNSATSTNTTGITVGGVKNRTASESHENRQPTYYGIYIQRIS